MNTVPARGTMSVRLVRLAHDALSLVVLLILVFNPVLTAAAAPARSYAAQPAPGSTPNIPGNPGVMPNTPADPGSTPATFDDLPPLVQAAYSEVVGEDNDTFHVLSDGQGGWQAAAPGHNFSSAFSSDGLRLQSGDDTLQLSLRQYGYGEHLSDIPTAAPQVSGNRVFYRRVVDHEDEPLLTEWYINGPLGLEQGFTLASPPSNSPQGGAANPGPKPFRLPARQPKRRRPQPAPDAPRRQPRPQL